MSEAESHHHGKNEIIIVKRHGGRHDGHHGGAWKIAYADFMTAMMAFFLIMWLVNAANEETKAAVASYFNPIKLSDPSPAERGLKKPAKDAEGENEQDKSKSEGAEKAGGQQAEEGKDKNASAGQEPQYSDADYFENPYSVIAEIVQQVDDQANVSEKGEGGQQESGPGTGADGGQAYRDPFDPDFWTQQVQVSRTTAADPSDKPAEISGLPGEGLIENGENTDFAFTGQSNEGHKDRGEKSADDVAKGEGPADKSGQTTVEKMGQTDKDHDGQTELPANVKLAQELDSQLKKDLKGRIGYLYEGLKVTPAEGGVLISISDQIKTPMFRIGSAVPTKETVVAIREIARIINERNGRIAIRGHTDARPFKSNGNDNWRLSSSRAQSAYFILKSAGVEEKRFSQISGYADTRLRNEADPYDANNRRIEILLEAEG